MLLTPGGMGASVRRGGAGGRAPSGQLRLAPLSGRPAAPFRPLVPPIKTQGIKTKLVGFILDNVAWDRSGRWVEPFLGSGVVLLNARPRLALSGDTNVHIVDFYSGVQRGRITAPAVREFLEREGGKLARIGGSYYYEVRDRFNSGGEPLDFLFLNRASFNGLMRFNSKGGYNVPFCKKTWRFTRSYVTKIVNQVGHAADILRGSEWVVEAGDWRGGVESAGRGDFLYLDPPYNGRSANYYDDWGDDDMRRLADAVSSTRSNFAMSIWYRNKYRVNGDIERHFAGFNVKKHRHFYHLGSKESLRNEMIEALITNY